MSDTSLNAVPCAICFETTLRDPRQLSCGHIYCCQCIQHLIDRPEPFLCPQCRVNQASLKCASDLQKYEPSYVGANHKETSNVNENARSTCDLCKVEDLWKRFAYCSSHDLFMCAHCALMDHQKCIQQNSIMPADDAARQQVIINSIRAQDVQQKAVTLATGVRKLDELQEKLLKIVAKQDDQSAQLHSCLSRNLQMFYEALNSEHAMVALIAQRKLEEASCEINNSHKTYSEMVDVVCKETCDFMRAFALHVNTQYCEVVPEKIKLLTNPFGSVCQQLIPVFGQLAGKGNRHTPAAIVDEIMSAIKTLTSQTHPNQAWAVTMGKDVQFGGQQRNDCSRGVFDFGNGFKLLIENHPNLQYVNIDQSKLDEYLVAATTIWQGIDATKLNTLATNATSLLGGGTWLCVADPHGSLALARTPGEKLWSSSVKVFGSEVTLYKLGN